MSKTKDRVAQDLRLKLAFENIAVRDLKSIFAKINKDFLTSYKVNGQAIDVSKYIPDMTAFLDKHYRRVTDGFIGSVASFNGLEIKQNDNTDEELILAVMLEWRQKESPLIAEQLTETTRKNVNTAIEQARNQLQEDGEEVNNTNIALNASAILRKKFNARSENIATSETQKAAETTKRTESDILSDIEPYVLGGIAIVSNTIKTWWTVGDKRVRNDHKSANGQRRNVSEPFNVGGERLMYPGDRSFGATAKNTANCRCSSLYNVGK